MNQIEAGLRAIHKALLDQGKILQKTHDLLAELLALEEQIPYEVTKPDHERLVNPDHDPRAIKAVE